MFKILPALTFPMGVVAASASKSLTSAMQREKKGGLLQDGAHWKLPGAEGVVCSVTRDGFNPKHPQYLNWSSSENSDLKPNWGLFVVF